MVPLFTQVPKVFLVSFGGGKPGCAASVFSGFMTHFITSDLSLVIVTTFVLFLQVKNKVEDIE